MRKGFTLTELLVFMGIFSILIFVLSNIFTAIVDAKLESESNSSIELDGDYLLGRLSYDISRANVIVFPTTLGVSAATLHIQTLDGDDYTYSLSGTNLVVNDTSGSYVLNAPLVTISNLSFTRRGNSSTGSKNTVTVTFTVTSAIARASGVESKTFSETIGVRCITIAGTTNCI